MAVILQIIRHYSRLFLDLLSFSLPRDIQSFRNDCEKLVLRYDALLKQISEYMKNHNTKYEDDDYEEVREPLPFTGADTFYLIDIKQDLENITEECDELLKKGEERPVELQLHRDAMQLLMKQLLELRRYSDQIESALLDFEDKIMKIEEDISNNTLWN